MGAFMQKRGPDSGGRGPSRAPLPEPRLVELLEEGARLFNAGRFFDSHEAWEHAWHGAPPQERDFFQGLIHAAAACLHHQRANEHGYGRQVERLERRLGRYTPSHRGVATADLVQAVLALPPPGDPATYPSISRTDGPQVQG